MLSHDFCWRFVLPQSEKRGSSQLAIAGPFLKCDFKALTTYLGRVNVLKLLLASLFKNAPQRPNQKSHPLAYRKQHSENPDPLRTDLIVFAQSLNQQTLNEEWR